MPRQTTKKHTRKRSRKARADLNAENARRYIDGPNGPDDPLLNVSAVCVDFGINYSTFMKRQDRGWVSLSGRKLMSHKRYWGRPGEIANRPEDTFLRSEVADAMEKPAPSKGRYQMPDGSYRLSTIRAMRELGNGRPLARTTLRKLEGEGKLTPRWMKSPETGYQEKTYAEQQVNELKEERNKERNADTTAGRKLISGEWHLSRKRAIRELTVGKRCLCCGATLAAWETKCPHLPEERGVECLTKTGCPTWYLENDVITIKKAMLAAKKPKKMYQRKRRPAKFDGGYDETKGKRFNLTRAGSEAKRFLGKPLKRNFLKKQLKKCRYHSDGKLPAEKRYPPRVRRNGIPEWTVLETDLKTLCENVAAARRDRLPPGKVNAGEIAERLGATSLEHRIWLGSILKEGRESGQLKFDRPTGPVNGYRRPYLYDPDEAIAFVRGYNRPSTADAASTDANEAESAPKSVSLQVNSNVKRKRKGRGRPSAREDEGVISRYKRIGQDWNVPTKERPSKRELAGRHEVGYATVERAIQYCVEHGLASAP